jgi:hypothetical protein
MAMPPAKNGDIHVYAYSQHNDHPFLSEGQWQWMFEIDICI